MFFSTRSGSKKDIVNKTVIEDIENEIDHYGRSNEVDNNK